MYLVMLINELTLLPTRYNISVNLIQYADTLFDFIVLDSILLISFRWFNKKRSHDFKLTFVNKTQYKFAVVVLVTYT